MGIFKPNVENLMKKQDIDGIIKALCYKKNDDIRINAAEALGELRDERAINPLIHVLEDEDEVVRESAEESLVMIGQPAVEPLIRVLNHKDEDVQESVIKTLAKIRDKRAVEPLIKLLKKGKSFYIVVKALSNIGDERVVKPLIQILRGRDPYSSTYISTGELVKEALERIGKPEPLIDFLRNSPMPTKDIYDAAVLKIVIEVIASFGDARAIELLEKRLKFDNLGFFDDSIVKALDRLKYSPPDNVSKIYHLIAKSSPNISRELLTYGSDAVEPLLHAMKSYYSPYPEITCIMLENVIDILGELGDEKAIKPIIRCLGDEYLDDSGLYSPGFHAAQALVRFGKPAFELLIKHIVEKEDIKNNGGYTKIFVDNAVWSIIRIDAKRTSEILSKMLLHLDNNYEYYNLRSGNEMRDIIIKILKQADKDIGQIK